MNHLFVPYEESLELKELGFDEPCFGYYNNNNEFTFFADVKNCNTNSEFGFHPTAPIFSQAFKWFREKHELYHIIHCPTKDTAVFTITSFSQPSVFSDMELKSYEEAELACLKKLIEIVKTNKA